MIINRLQKYIKGSIIGLLFLIGSSNSSSYAATQEKENISVSYTEAKNNPNSLWGKIMQKQEEILYVVLAIVSIILGRLIYKKYKKGDSLNEFENSGGTNDSDNNTGTDVNLQFVSLSTINNQNNNQINIEEKKYNIEEKKDNKDNDNNNNEPIISDDDISDDDNNDNNNNNSNNNDDNLNLLNDEELLKELKKNDAIIDNNNVNNNNNEIGDDNSIDDNDNVIIDNNNVNNNNNNVKNDNIDDDGSKDDDDDNKDKEDANDKIDLPQESFSYWYSKHLDKNDPAYKDNLGTLGQTFELMIPLDIANLKYDLDQLSYELMQENVSQAQKLTQETINRVPTKLRERLPENIDDQSIRVTLANRFVYDILAYYGTQARLDNIWKMYSDSIPLALEDKEIKKGINTLLKNVRELKNNKYQNIIPNGEADEASIERKKYDLIMTVLQNVSNIVYRQEWGISLEKVTKKRKAKRREAILNKLKERKEAAKALIEGELEDANKVYEYLNEIKENYEKLQLDVNQLKKRAQNFDFKERLDNFLRRQYLAGNPGFDTFFEKSIKNIIEDVNIFLKKAGPFEKVVQKGSLLNVNQKNQIIISYNKIKEDLERTKRNQYNDASILMRIQNDQAIIDEFWASYRLKDTILNSYESLFKNHQFLQKQEKEISKLRKENNQKLENLLNYVNNENPGGVNNPEIRKINRLIEKFGQMKEEIETNLSIYDQYIKIQVNTIQKQDLLTSLLFNDPKNYENALEDIVKKIKEEWNAYLGN